MPNKEYSEMTESTRSIMPKDITKGSVQDIMLHDLMGLGTNDIAEALQMTASRISVIKGSPLYREQIARKRQELSRAVIEKKSDRVVGDPVDKIFEDAELEAAHKIVDLAREGKNEFIQKMCATEILAHRGRIPRASTRKSMVIEVTDKMADRFERILGREEPSIKISIREETDGVGL